MSKSYFVTTLVFSILVLLAALGQAFAASMPAGLIGKWCAEQWISVTPAGFRGSADSDEYGCDLKHIKEIENSSASGTWRAIFSCHGEFGRVEVNSLMALQMLNHSPFLVVSNTLSRPASKKVSVPPLIAYAKCQ
jgi:hypothetical protein